MDLDTLKANCQKIHAFGLGFIQLKLSKTKRLHFYVPEVNKTGGDMEAHNHRYQFTSMIMKGTLINEIYHFEPNESGLYEMVDEACSKERPPSTKAPVKGNLIRLAEHQMVAGSDYHMHADTLHMVRTNRAITALIRPADGYKDFAQVVHKTDEELVCPFSANLPEKDLWEIVEREINESY